MRGFLDLPDDGLAVIFEGTGNNHEARKVQVTLQRLTGHLPHLHRQIWSTSKALTALFFHSHCYEGWTSCAEQ